MRLLFSVLSGILYLFSFAPWDQGYLQWIAFLPLFLGLGSLSKSKRIFIYGLGMSLPICIGGFFWIIYATQQYGGLSFPAALALFFVFCLIGQLQIPIYLLLRNQALKNEFFQRKPWAWIFLSGLLYAGIESFYPKLFLDTAAHAFYRSPFFRQSTDIGGVFFLTAIIISVNEIWCKAIQKRNWRSRFSEVFAGAGIIAGVTLYGNFRLQQIHSLLEEQKNHPSLKVSMIQPNIGDFLKIQAEQGQEDATQLVMDKMIGMSTEAQAKNSDAILWPETAYPALFGRPFSPAEARMELRLRDFSRDYSGMLLFGGYDHDFQRLEYNSLFFYQGKKEIPEVYHKVVLLPFGETLPFTENFPAIEKKMKEWFPTMGFFGRGPGAQIFAVPNHEGVEFKLAPSICYEGLLDFHSADGALLGADAHINVTNDSWFGEKGEPYLHLALTTFRSIETRLPMLRSTNTGFSAAIDATGEIIQKTELFQPAILTASVHKRLSVVSPYLWMSQYFGGNWFARFCQIVMFVFLGWVWRNRRQSL